MVAFKNTVMVEPGVIGRFRVVVGPDDAVDVLTGRWPKKTGEKYRTALAACRRASAGTVKPYVARRAFEAAARDARVLIEADDAGRYVSRPDLLLAPGRAMNANR